ncbi:MAG: PLP-dependent transferase [Opitutae bacterium]|nr:PLP-dependent transferase [Opitutae bacterium]MBT6957430.1 PLP-dependent transferase [Opitutae bacterium]
MNFDTQVDAFQHHPLGQRFPDSPHAVCVSLPTMADVIGYEEKDPAVVETMKSGYPRFFLPEFVRQLAEHIANEISSEPRDVLLVNSSRAASELLAFIGLPSAKAEDEDGFAYIHFPQDPDTYKKALNFLQHTGCGISSRQAEDLLLREGLLSSIFAEETVPADLAESTVHQNLSSIVGIPEDDILLCNSGMNAFYAAYLAACEIQRPQGRDIWIQLGWLYLDTREILEKFLGPDERLIRHLDVFDVDGLESLFRENRGRIAGIITEAPTNPLIQTPDLEHIHSIAREEGALLIADPTISSPANIALLSHTDLLVNSLTKYAASSGDILSGAIFFNPASLFYEELKELIPVLHEPLHPRDLQRLAHEISRYPDVINQINRNTKALANFLDGHPAIKKLHWAYSPESRSNYEKLVRQPDSPGGLLTIELNFPITEFYDRIRIIKSPSFGTFFSMICPFMYLAHYNLVSTKEGRIHLNECGINPDLVRVAIGTEDTERLLAIFEEALA